MATDVKAVNASGRRGHGIWAERNGTNCLLFIIYYLYQQMHICILKYQIILQTLLHVSVLLHNLQGALILRLVKV
jgi:hypothetical protein